MKINGIWKSSSGSTLEIEEVKGKIFGTYHLGKDNPERLHDINGCIDPDDAPDVRPLSFSVAWTYEDGKSGHSVTAYTGQLNTKGKKPNIEVIFLIANDKTPLWKGTGISYENFEKTL